MEIIGLSGYARSGKDEFAKVLVGEFGYTRVAFADKLREVLYQLNPVIIRDPEVVSLVEVPQWMRLRDIIDEFTWEGYKGTVWTNEIRQLLQRLGTEAGRQTLGENIWVDAALTGFEEDAKIVVTDCRYPNEARAIKERGGHVVRVHRAGIGPANDHPSETSLDNWKFDYTITNDGTLEDYRDKIHRFIDMYGEARYFEHVLGM